MRAFILLLVALPVVVFADDITPVHKPMRIPPPPKAATAKAAPARALVSPPAPVRVAALDEGECRTGCAQTRYFCDANDASGDCSGAWSRCVATCGLQNLDPGVSTSP